MEFGWDYGREVGQVTCIEVSAKTGNILEDVSSIIHPGIERMGACVQAGRKQKNR